VSLSEFDLIGTYFAHLGAERDDVLLAVGDDCALLRPPPDMDLALTTDTLVADRHFFADVDPETLGHKALAVNLSDLAAVGATPAWASLALTLPQVDERWLQGFVSGFSRLAASANLALIGGDTTCGPLAITLQVQGLLPRGAGLRRSAAQPGDRVYVSGTLGDAALALWYMQRGTQPKPSLLERLQCPQPRWRLGQRLLNLAHACIDVSDGLVADLGHICRASGLAARIELEQLPLSAAMAAHVQRTGDWHLPLAGGDDYELCFTLSATRQTELLAIAADLQLPLTPIGTMEQGVGVRCRQADGALFDLQRQGFDHFL
jgi:thiamine-monophosphate kinase